MKTTASGRRFSFCISGRAPGRPKPARLAMCSRLNAASIAVPSGAEAGHGKSC